MEVISAIELAEWLADPSREKPVLLDVREPNEYEICHIQGSQLIPMHTIPLQLDELDEDAKSFVYAITADVVCKSHISSREMASIKSLI